MKRIITVQHTQSIHHTNGMVGSWTDWALTDYGVKQAQRIAENLYKQFTTDKFKLFSSDLKRAAMTALPIAELFDIDINFDKRLREVNVGRACGQSNEWLQEHKMSGKRNADYKHFEEAESNRDLWNRLYPFYEEVIKSEENVIIVSHGVTLSMFNLMWLGLPVDVTDTLNVNGASGGVSIMTIKDDGVRKLARMSDMSFLK